MWNSRPAYEGRGTETTDEANNVTGTGEDDWHWLRKQREGAEMAGSWPNKMSQTEGCEGLPDKSQQTLCISMWEAEDSQM